MDFVDRVQVSDVFRRQSDGALVANARVARTGIQLYTGREVDPDNEHGFRDKATVRVYRPGSEVFSRDTLASVAHRPVTNNHPTESRIDEKNWKEWAVGQTSDEVRAEGIYIRVPLMVSDGAAIGDIENGKRELSSGYESILDWTPGTNDAGEEYDAVQRNIRFNHVAIVQRGRAGSSVRIGDEAAGWGVSPVGDEGDRTMTTTMKQVTVDGVTIETTDQGAQVIQKLQDQIRQLTDTSAQTLKDHATALAQRDADIAKKDGEIAELKKKTLDAASLDKLVAARAVLVDSARLVFKDIKVDGLDDAGIRLAAVTGALGADVVKDKSPAYIDARFDILVEEAKKKGGDQDTFRQASISTHQDQGTGADDRTKSYQDMVSELSSAYKPKAA